MVARRALAKLSCALQRRRSADARKAALGTACRPPNKQRRSGTGVARDVHTTSKELHAQAQAIAGFLRELAPVAVQVASVDGPFGETATHDFSGQAVFHGKPERHLARLRPELASLQLHCAVQVGALTGCSCLGLPLAMPARSSPRVLQPHAARLEHEAHIGKASRFARRGQQWETAANAQLRAEVVDAPLHDARALRRPLLHQAEALPAGCGASARARRSIGASARRRTTRTRGLRHRRGQRPVRGEVVGDGNGGPRCRGRLAPLSVRRLVAFARA
mmetsp:Transcript_47460/g.144455  ORF Transcript_47460/g.144455 Transcript_47460/m.144455 type:complete len:277 (-) Transcript_47460:388-1218(-)